MKFFSHRNMTALGIALLFLAVFLSYTSSMTGEFTFDDLHTIQTNALIKDISRFKDIDWIGASVGGIRPVASLTFSLNYAVGRLNVSGYHLVNVLIHLAVVLMIYLFSKKTFSFSGYRNPGLPALITAGIFGLHPLQSQAVSYVAQRYEILASLFYLLALFFFAVSREKGFTIKGMLAYAAALAAFLLGLGSKEIIITLPAALLIYEYYFLSQREAGPHRGRGLRERMEKILLFLPFFLLGILYGVAKLEPLGGGREVGFHVEGPSSITLTPTVYLMTQLRILLTYLRLIFFPVGQNLDPDVPVYRSFFDPAAFLSFLFLGLLLLAALFLLHRSRRALPTDPDSPFTAPRLRLVSFGILWFFLVLAPTSSIIPIIDLMFEHRVYLASWGIIAPCVALCYPVFGRIGREGGGRKNIAGMITVIILLFGLGVLTYERNKVWRTNVSLWSDVVSKSPLKSRAHMNLGHAYNQAGRYQEALSEYEKALGFPDERFVRKAEILRNVGATMVLLGRIDDSIQTFREALRIEPLNADILNNLAISYLEKGSYREALYYAEFARKANPYKGEALNTMGEVYFRKGEYGQALPLFLEAMKINPDIPSRSHNVALTYEKLGKQQESCRYWKEYVAIESDGEKRKEVLSHMEGQDCF